MRIIISNQAEFLRFFFKGILKDENGDYQLNDGQFNDTSLPSKGDLLVCREQLAVMNPKTHDVYGEVFIYPGDIIQF